MTDISQYACEECGQFFFKKTDEEESVEEFDCPLCKGSVKLLGKDVD